MIAICYLALKSLIMLISEKTSHLQSLKQLTEKKLSRLILTELVLLVKTKIQWITVLRR